MTLQVSPQTRRVFHLSLPIFAELLLQLLVGNMDQFMISHFGSAAVAAIGNGNQVMNVVIIVLTTMSTAATILLTQHIGAGRSALSRRGGFILKQPSSCKQESSSSR